VRTGAAFLAGVVLGAAGAWLVVTRGRVVVAPATAPSAPGTPAAAAPSSAPAGSPAVTAGPPEAAFPGAPSPDVPALGVPEIAISVPPAAPSPWAPTPEPEAPLGTRSPSPVPGDSTDALLTPRSLAAPADVPALPSVNDLDRLRSRHLLLPIQGYDLRELRDNFAEKRGTRVHEAIDMAAVRGTPVLAVDDGTVKKLFTSAAGGLTVYQFDQSGAYSYYYAHLDRYAEGLHEGQAVKKGDRLGYVGTSGNAPPNTPHLHFTIFKLGPDRRWWEGTPINPYPLWALRR
jgi:murein DD-endopeptidase MepM/ murein hydrolase activator NlpD